MGGYHNGASVGEIGLQLFMRTGDDDFPHAACTRLSPEAQQFLRRIHEARELRQPI